MIAILDFSQLLSTNSVVQIVVVQQKPCFFIKFSEALFNTNTQSQLFTKILKTKSEILDLTILGSVHLK